MSHNQSYKLPKRNKFRAYRKMTIWILLIISLVVGFIYWMNHDSLKVENINISENKFVSEAEILNIYNEEISKKFLFFLPRQNFLFVPEKKIEERLKEISPVEDAFVDVEGIRNVNIEITEYKPVAIYYGESKSFFVNKNGLLFVETPEFHVDDLVTVESPVSDGELLGKQYTDEKVFQKLMETYGLLLKEDIKIAKIVTEDFETYTFETISGTNILVESTDNPKTIIENLQATLSQESIHEIQFNNIEYFDLRFEDKVFYKLK